MSAAAWFLNPFEKMDWLHRRASTEFTDELRERIAMTPRQYRERMECVTSSLGIDWQTTAARALKVRREATDSYLFLLPYLRWSVIEESDIRAANALLFRVFEYESAMFALQDSARRKRYAERYGCHV